MDTFKDHFSRQSDIYLKYRPVYPEGLYSWLAGLVRQNELVWDCGTGNGQAAIGLAAYFDKVIATDPSQKQIENAIPHPKVSYLVEKAESTHIQDGSVDMVTIANALHWFDFDAFYKEVRRVLKKDGLIAAWAYPTPSISPEVDKVVFHYHDHTLNDFWQHENRLVEHGYKDVPFPFHQIESPGFSIEKKVDLEGVIGYLNTWSGTQKYIARHGHNPTGEVREALQAVWGDPLSEKTMSWKLVLKVGRP